MSRPLKHFTRDMVIGKEFVGNIFHGHLRVEDMLQRSHGPNDELVSIVWIDRQGKEFMRFPMCLHNIIDQLNREVLVPKEDMCPNK